MSRQKFEKTFNTFTKGLMTEASELNFPEDFSLYEKNFLLHRDGGRDRRRGMELLYPLGVTLTSKPYEIEKDEDEISLNSRALHLLDKRTVIPVDDEGEQMSAGASLTSLRFRTVSLDEDWGEEGVGLGSNVYGIRWRSTLVESVGDGEQISAGAKPYSIKLDKVLVSYQHPDPEQVSMGSNVTGIFLNES